MTRNKYKIVLIIGLNCGKRTYDLLNEFEQVEIISVHALSPKNSNNIAGYIDFGKIIKKDFFYYNKIDDVHKKLRNNKNIDLIVAIGISEILKENILSIPKKGVLGAHAAKLPDRRGSSPIIWAILDGLKESEMTLFRMSQKIDEGPIYSSKRIKITDENTAGEIRDKMDNALISLLKTHVLDIISGKNKGKIKKRYGIYTRKRNIKDGQLNLLDNSKNILRKIRALSNPYPGAHLYGGDGYPIIIEKAKIGGKDLMYEGCGNNFKKNVLCVVSHADDEALGLGGTLIRHASEGDKVNIIILSEGEDAKSTLNKKNPNRLNNAQEWANNSNCNLYKVCNFPDQKLDSIPQIEMVRIIEKAMEDLMPNIVYIHHPGDMNSDHQIAAQVSLAAIRPMSYHKVIPEIRAFETPSSTDQAPNIDPYIFKPNFYVSITDYWDRKLEGLKIYSSEIKSNPHPRSIKSIKSLAIKRGAESGLKMAEAFYIIRSVWK